MGNRYSYGGMNSIPAHMSHYNICLKKHDLNVGALIEFVDAIKLGKVDVIREQFVELSSKQKLGLLNIKLDCNDLREKKEVFKTRVREPAGTAIQIAEYYDQVHICKFLEEQKSQLAAVHKGFFADKKGTEKSTEPTLDVSSSTKSKLT